MRRFSLIASCCLSLTLGQAGRVWAGEFKSAIVTTTPLTITVASGKLLIINNFSQQGGDLRGVVSVTANGLTSAVLNAALLDAAAATSPTPTPTATPIVAPEIMNQIAIAGPAVVTVPPITNATLFITYRQAQQPDH